MTRKVYKALDVLGGWLLPARCVLCRGPGHARRRDLCAACEADLPRLELQDEICFAPFAYAFPFDRLIPALKYEGALTHARVLGVLLGEAVAARAGQNAVDVIVPMPLHASRHVERGYNQASEIARYTAATLGLILDPRALRRTRATAAQVGLDRDARRRNVHGAFAASPDHVAGRRVALLDDVVTTGSTVTAAAATLRAAGTAHVEVWCVARALA